MVVLDAISLLFDLFAQALHQRRLAYARATFENEDPGRSLRRHDEIVVGVKTLRSVAPGKKAANGFCVDMIHLFKAVGSRFVATPAHEACGAARTSSSAAAQVMLPRVGLCHLAGDQKKESVDREQILRRKSRFRGRAIIVGLDTSFLRPGVFCKDYGPGQGPL